MFLSPDLRKALLTGAVLTAASVAAAFLPVYAWLQVDPEIDVASVYLCAVLLPLIIAPSCSFFILRARMKAERLARENHRLANSDELTGLPNRRAFFAAAASLQVRAQTSGGVFVCAIADIDNFKQVNDEFGHEAGDAVLKSVGAALQRAAPEGGFIARLGGEEFAFAAVFGGEPAARAYCQRLVNAVRHTESAHGDIVLCVTISLGYCFGEPGATMSGLLSRADAALYRAKHSGKDCALGARDVPGGSRGPSPHARAV